MRPTPLRWSPPCPGMRKRWPGCGHRPGPRQRKTDEPAARPARECGQPSLPGWRISRPADAAALRRLRPTIHSYFIVRRAALPAFADRVPYVLALIDLAEGPRMMSQILGENALQAHIGAAVELCFETCADGAQLPQFRLVHHG